jgi:chromosome segregation ATPase
MKVSGSFEIRPRGGDLDGGTSSSRRAPDNHRGGDDALFDEFNDTLARLEGAGRDRGSTSGLITQIEQLAAVVERQAQELRVTRAAASKLEAENERMRQMLKALIAAIDAGETRLFGTVEKAERRLRELIDTGTPMMPGSVPTSAAPESPGPLPARPRPQRPSLEPAPTQKSSIRVIE